MSRRFLDDVRADLTALLVTGGATTAPELNALLIDTIDSSIQDESVIASNAPSLAVATAIAFAPLTTGIYDVEVGGDASFLIPDIVNGNITTSSTAGFTYELEGKVSFNDLGANIAIDFCILKNGVQEGFIAELTGGGGTRSRTASFSHITLSAGASDVFQIGVQTPVAVNTIDINSIALSCTIQPTNNP